jgi:hypothetical protein
MDVEEERWVEPPPGPGPVGAAVAVGLAVVAVEVLAALIAGRASLGMAVSALASDAVVAAAVGLAVGRFAGAGAAAASAAVLLLGAFVAPGVADLVAEGRLGGAALLSVVPALVAGVVGLGARRLPRLGLPVLGAGVAALVLFVPFAPDPTPRATASGPSLLVLTVDGLSGSRLPPELGVLVPRAVTFVDAVTPTGAVLPANAAVATGLHPLRNEVLADGDRLSRRFPVWSEVVSEAGWPAAAFVSSSEVDRRSGLDRGFAVYDDRWVTWDDSALGRIFGAWAPRSTRPAEQTASRLARWAAERSGPWAAWVQLEADETLPRAAAALGGALSPGDVVVVVGTGGRSERGPLFDEVVHVPLAMSLPDPPAVPEVAAQVRTLDVAASVIEALGISADVETEGVELGPYGEGTRQAPLSCTLVAHGPDGWALGLRNNRVKAIRGADGALALYLLDSDPGEEVDRSADRAGVVEQVRAVLAPDGQALARLVGS